MGAFEKFKALKAAESLGGVATKAGGIAVKLGPIVAVAAAIGAAIYYVANNLEDVRAKIQQTFGDEGLKIFDQIWASITMVGDAFKTAFAGVSTDVFQHFNKYCQRLFQHYKQQQQAYFQCWCS